MGFLGCAAVTRREAYLASAGFSRLLFIGGEEELLAYDLAAAGWAACYCAGHRRPPPPFRRPTPAARRHQEARNRALVAWLRRPLGCALTETGRLARRAGHDPVAARALGSLAIRLPLALRPASAAAGVETAIRTLEWRCRQPACRVGGRRGPRRCLTPGSPSW